MNDMPALMDAFYNLGQKTIIKILEEVSSPHARKTLRTWGINDASKMVSKSVNTMKKLEGSNTIAKPSKDASGRRAYTLDDINLIRDICKTRYTRHAGSSPIICTITNFKGGVGKSTTAQLLMQYMAIQGMRVLGVDLDPQASLSTFFGLIPDIDLKDDDTILTSLLINSDDIERVILKTYFTGIDLIPGNLELQNADINLPDKNKNNHESLGSPINRLKKSIDKVSDKYDLIIIDCAPNTGALTMNAISASNAVLITLPPSMTDFASFVRLTKTLKSLFELTNPSIDFLRILFTKHKNNLASNKLDQVMRQKYGEYILVNHMVDSAEIDNSTNLLLSLYEKKYQTNSGTYKRALEASNKVNAEIFESFKEIWRKQSDR